MALNQVDPIASENYYLDVLCAHTDKAYQFALGLICDVGMAKKLLFSVYQGFSKDLPVPSTSGDGVYEVFKRIWLEVQGPGATQDPSLAQSSTDSSASMTDQQTKDQEESSLFSEMSLLERAVLVLDDHFCLSKETVEYILGIDPSHHIQILATSRRKLMANIE